MLSDIYQEPCKVEIEGKEYLFEFDHASLSSLERRTQKSIYEIYDNLISKKFLWQDEVYSLVICSMLKHHSTEDIKEMEEKFRAKPGWWQVIKEEATTAFLIPMMPPNILTKVNPGSKKKQPSKRKKAVKK